MVKVLASGSVEMFPLLMEFEPDITMAAQMCDWQLLLNMKRHPLYHTGSVSPMS